MKKLYGLLSTVLIFSSTLFAPPITSDNISSYALGFTGTGAACTWPINITGAATGLSGYTGSYVVYWDGMPPAN